MEPMRWPAPLSEIDDGLGNTLLLVEQSGLPDWFARGGAPADPPPESPWCGAWMSCDCFDVIGAWTGINTHNAYSLYSFHPGGAHAAACDGSVHFLGEELDVTVLAALVTRAGGEAVSLP
jgi:hypothetical protein